MAYQPLEELLPNANNSVYRLVRLASTRATELATTGVKLVQAPLAKACFVLAKEFGWTPEQVSGMTIGQILLYLEMAQGSESR